MKNSVIKMQASNTYEIKNNISRRVAVIKIASSTAFFGLLSIISIKPDNTTNEPERNYGGGTYGK